MTAPLKNVWTFQSSDFRKRFKVTCFNVCVCFAILSCKHGAVEWRKQYFVTDIRSLKVLQNSYVRYVLSFQRIVSQDCSFFTTINFINASGKASFPRDDKQGVQVDHLTVFHTDIEKLLQKQRSLIYDLETSKVKVSDSQKRGVDMIKKGMVNNRFFCFALFHCRLITKTWYDQIK